jgi:hypothetical protein
MANLEGVVRISSKNESAATFLRQMACCQQYVQISAEEALKSVSKMFRIKVTSPCAFDFEHTLYN